MRAWGARGAAMLLGLVGPAIAGCSHKAGPGASAAASTAAPGATDLAADDRIAWLLAPCARPDPFLADTGDMTAVLVSKLARGQLDPMRQEKTELTEM